MNKAQGDYNYGLLANDSDPENDSMEAVIVTPPQHFGFNYVQGGTFQLANIPGHENFRGLDSFTYKACDVLNACSAPATAYILVSRDGDDEENAGSDLCNINSGKSVGSLAVGEPVNVSNGNMWIKHTDYNLPGVGQSINITRTYNSVQTWTGLFGFGWSSQYDQYINIYDDRMVRLHLADGRAIYFIRPDTASAYAPADGRDFHALLVKNTNGSFTLTHKNGGVWEFNAGGRLLSTKDRNNNQTTLTYDSLGQLKTVNDARNNTTTLTYDSSGRLTQVKDANNKTTNFAYDARVRLTSTTNALNQTTNYEYDNFNRLKKIVHPPFTSGANRLEERLEYDAVGNVKKQIDTANRETLYDYDTAHRLIKTTDALSQITQFEYNARSQMTKVTDALNQQYVFAYDALGRQLSQTRAGTTMSYEYDAVGNRTKRTDYIGRETSYEYDNLNRLTKILYVGDPDNPAPKLQSTYGYDDISRLISAVNEAGTVSFAYDNRNRTTSTTDVFGHILNYQYDASSNRTQLKLDGAVHTNYAYDDASRLTTLTDEASQNFTFGYDVADRLISKTLPNGISTTFNYDGMSRLTRLKHQSTTATLTDNNFSYNPANQISQIAELAQTKNFSYDNVNRVTGMTNGTANENYAFDGVGNRSSSHLSNAYGYQANNNLTSTQTATYSYDANGNMRSKEDSTGYWIYTWDNENRMTSARKQNKIVRYQYDALGRRVSRKGKTLGSTKYTYDGLDVVMDDDLNNGIVKYQNGLGIDDKLKMVANGQAKYFLQDHLGSTVSLTDASGSAVSSASYDSFGNATGNLSTRYQFTGREKDEFTGLMYYRARWYDSKLGRFISEDPIGFAGGDINLYGYVWNNPQSFTDPMGLEGGWGSNSADWLDKRIAVARDFYQADVGYWGWNGTVNTIGDLASGVSDLLRVGNGTAHALYCEDNIYGQAAYITMDVARAAGIASIILGATAGRVGNTSGNSMSGSGLSNRGFRPPAGTRIKPNGIPENWRIKPTKGIGGTRYVDPKNPGNAVRVMPGDPKSPYPNSQQPYVR